MKKYFVILIACIILSGCSKQEVNIKESYNDYIQINEYKHVYDIPESAKIVTEEDINEELQTYLDLYNENISNKKEGTIEEGQKLNVSYSISIDGVTTDYNKNVIIGEDNIAPGIDEYLIGKQTGFIGTYDYVYPENYEDTFANKKAQIHIIVNYIVSDSTYAEITDEFVAELTNNKYTTIESYKEYVLNDRTEATKIEYGLFAFQEILNNSTYKKNISALVNDAYKMKKSEYITYAENNEMTLEELYAEYGCESKKEFNKLLKILSENDIKQQLVTYKLAELLNVSINTDDIEEYKNKYLDDLTEEEIKEYTDEYIYDCTLYIAVAKALYEVQ